MGKMKYDISVSGILRALYSVPIFRSVALSTNLFFVLGTVRFNARTYITEDRSDSDPNSDPIQIPDILVGSGI